MPKRGRRRKKTRTHVVENENAASALESAKDLKVPRSLVIRRGKVESEVIELMSEARLLSFCSDSASRYSLHAEWSKSGVKKSRGRLAVDWQATPPRQRTLTAPQNRPRRQARPRPRPRPRLRLCIRPCLGLLRLCCRSFRRYRHPRLGPGRLGSSGGV